MANKCSFKIVTSSLSSLFFITILVSSHLASCNFTDEQLHNEDAAITTKPIKRIEKISTTAPTEDDNEEIHRTTIQSFTIDQTYSINNKDNNDEALGFHAKQEIVNKHGNSEDNASDNSDQEDVERGDAEEEEEEDDDGDDEELVSNVCTAEFFLDKIIPQDYPTEINKDVKHINETIERLNRMYNFSNQMVERLNPFIRELGSRVTDFLYEAELDSHCMVSLFRIMSGLGERKSWALSFLDATGPILNSGNQEGKFVSLGEFDQCLEIESTLPEENVNNVPVRGQYCLVKPIVPVPDEIQYRQGEPIAQSKIEQVKHFLNDEYIKTYLELYKFMKSTILRIGICLPDKCTPIDMENAINRMLVRKTGLSVKIGNCAKAADDFKLNKYQVTTLFIFGVFILLIVACSLYEMIYRILLDSGRFTPCHDMPIDQKFISTPYSFTSSQHQYPVKWVRQQSTASAPYTNRPLEIQVFTSFSIIRNTRVLFEIPAYRKLSLDTLRLLFILYFFIINTYFFTIVFAPMIIKRFYVLGPWQLVSEKKYFFIRLIYLLDCLIAFSGISFVLSFKSRSFNYLNFILQTYLRYVLPILFSLGLIYVIPLFGSGPLWHLFEETITQPCKTNLWPTLFFYNNFSEVEEICNLPTVFISLIFQLKLIAPMIMIVATYLRPKSSLLFLALAFCTTIIWNLIPWYLLDFKFIYEYKEMKSFSEIKFSWMFYGFHPSFHLCSLIFGIAAGFVIRDRPTSKYSHIMIIGILSLLGFIFGHIYLEYIDIFNPNLSTLEIMILLTFGRIPMLIFFCWLVYASLSGHITIMKRFLSSVVWRPLAQLSYGFYICSIFVIAYRLFSIREPTTFSAQNMFRTIVSDMAVAFFLSYLVHIMVQQPMRNLRHILIQWRLLFDLNNSNDQQSPNHSETPPPENHKFDFVFEDKIIEKSKFTQEENHGQKDKKDKGINAVLQKTVLSKKFNGNSTEDV